MTRVLGTWPEFVCYGENKNMSNMLFRHLLFSYIMRGDIQDGIRPSELMW